MSTLHPSVVAVRESADSVMGSGSSHAGGSFWRRWFESDEDHFADHVRGFVHKLGRVRDIPPSELSAADLKSLAADTERVISKVEDVIDEAARRDPAAAEPLTHAVYAIRRRFEDLYRRGAGRA